MNTDETEPISVQAGRRFDPWKILAGVSTAVSVATVATLVWTVNKVSDEPTPAERMSAAAGVTTPAAHPAPAPSPVAVTETVAPESVVAQASPPNSSLQQYFPMQGSVPAPAAPAPMAAPWQPPAGAAWPAINVPPPNIMVNPGFSIDAIIGAVTGTAGWVGGGTLNLLGDVIVASAMNNQGPTDPLTALAAPLTRIPPPQWPRELDVTKIPPPQWPRELDVTKIPPPQWPRELDVTKIPPPHVHWDRLLPRF